MIDESVVRRVLVGESTVLVLCVTLFFLHGLWLFLSQRREKLLINGARETLAHLLTNGATAGESFEALRSLPRALQAGVFLEISQNLSGTGKERLRHIAEEVSLLSRARKFCRSRLWSRRLMGSRLLARMDVPDPIMEALLTDPHAAVRAQAAEWAAAHPSVPVVVAILDLLADPETLARFAVKNSLFRMGPIVTGPLVRFLETRSGEAAESGLLVAEALAGPAFLPAAIRLSANEEAPVRVAAARLLGAIGDASCATRLTALLGDSDPDVRAVSARALGRMRHWQAASDLANALHDPSWRVRNEAAMALRAIGGPGALFLRRALTENDSLAADMAQLVLDLPAAAG